VKAITTTLFRELVAEARLAPSIHNIQPTRWRLLPDGSVMLLDDTTVRTPYADPTGHDVRVSHGAALEGMSLALDRRGLAIATLSVAEPQSGSRYAPVCMATVVAAEGADPLSAAVFRRMSWRGRFRPSAADEIDFDRITAVRDDVICIRYKPAIDRIARWADEAELFFIRRDAYRRELLQWMRLSRRDPLYRRSGLNRESLAMSAIEALGAGFVLGSLFAPLDRLGLAAPLISDRAKSSSAAAIVLLHRPVGEDPLVTGRHFYRAWLELDRVGLAACPISALADHPVISGELSKLAGVGAGRRLVNVFRAGPPPGAPTARHFRQPVDELIV
jgi:nitroreductase